jgi:hypothetical protein
MADLQLNRTRDQINADLALARGAAPASHAHEGSAVLSTGETGGTKFLREDGDGTSSWAALPGATVLAVTALPGTPDPDIIYLVFVAE